MNTLVQDTYKSSLLSSGHQQAPLKAQEKQLKPAISAGTMSHIGNVDNVHLGNNKGNVGSNNDFSINGCVGNNAAVGNTTGIRGNNAGCIGSGNTFNIKGVGAGQRLGNTSDVNVGCNSGSIGSGNRFSKS
ncbi:uncharacterized protein LOC144528130 isoform X2 [Sander vitreus]